MKIMESLLASFTATILGCIAAAFIWYLLTCFPGACRGNDFYVAFSGLILLPILAPLSLVGFPIIYSEVEKRPWSKAKRKNMLLGLGVVAIGVVGVLTMMFQPPTIREWVVETMANGAVIVAAWFIYLLMRRRMSG